MSARFRRSWGILVGLSLSPAASFLLFPHRFSQIYFCFKMPVICEGPPPARGHLRQSRPVYPTSLQKRLNSQSTQRRSRAVGSGTRCRRAMAWMSASAAASSPRNRGVNITSVAFRNGIR